MHLFDRVIKPILLYGSDMLGGFNNYDKDLYMLFNKDVYEKCHLKFCRMVLGVGKKAPNIGIYGETGTTRMQVIKLKPMYLTFHLSYQSFIQ